MTKKFDLFRFFHFILLFNQSIDLYSFVDAKKCDRDNEPIFVHTLCRHGDRNIKPYPNDPYLSECKYWPGGYDQLTNLGKKQEYNLGKYLKKRYAKLTKNGRYNVDLVYVRSTDNDRVIMSAEACLAGLFPPHETPRDQFWNKHLGRKWQPIPVHIVPDATDYVLEAHVTCNRYNELYDSTEQMTFNSLVDPNEQLINYLEYHSGENLTSLRDVQKLREVLEIEKMRGLSLPKWAQEVYPDETFKFIALSRFPSYTVTPEMKKIKSGYLLKEIMDRFKNKTENILSPDRSLWMYFAHETTLVNMLNTLGLYKTLHVPPYASCILFELYQCAGTPYVQIFYKNTTKSPSYLLPEDIPNCGPICPLEKMYELYDDVLPKQNFDEECNNDVKQV